MFFHSSDIKSKHNLRQARDLYRDYKQLTAMKNNCLRRTLWSKLLSVSDPLLDTFRY